LAGTAGVLARLPPPGGGGAPARGRRAGVPPGGKLGGGGEARRRGALGPPVWLPGRCRSWCCHASSVQRNVALRKGPGHGTVGINRNATERFCQSRQILRSVPL